MNKYLIPVLAAYIFKEAFGYAVLFLNLGHMKKAGVSVPAEFEGRADAALLEKAMAYETEKTRFGFVSSIFGNIVTVAFLFCGLLDIYNSWIASLGLSFVASGWLFFILLALADEILSVPFSLYRTFRIENRFGFNTMTPKLWLADFAKSLLISAVVLSLVSCAGLWLIQWSPGLWWLWVWGFLLVFSVFMMYISPYLIEPLFNKFTAVDDEALKEKITALAEKAGIHAGSILKIDASRRSRHTNAYFTGIGKTKRIVLYDTLLAGMDRGEILSVLAHEIGHWKKKHLLKMMIAMETFSFVALYIAFRIIQGDLLVRLFNISSNTLFAKFVLVAFLAGIIMLPLQPLVNYLVRRHERQADRASFDLTGNTESMVSALVKLSKENLSNLHPHPLHVIMHYSHPPVLERIRYIREFVK